MSNIVLRVISKAGKPLPFSKLLGRSRIEIPATATFGDLKNEVKVLRINTGKVDDKVDS